MPINKNKTKDLGCRYQNYFDFERHIPEFKKMFRRDLKRFTEGGRRDEFVQMVSTELQQDVAKNEEGTIHIPNLNELTARSLENFIVRLIRDCKSVTVCEMLEEINRRLTNEIRQQKHSINRELPMEPICFGCLRGLAVRHEIVANASPQVPEAPLAREAQIDYRVVAPSINNDDDDNGDALSETTEVTDLDELGREPTDVDVGEFFDDYSNNFLEEDEMFREDEMRCSTPRSHKDLKIDEDFKSRSSQSRSQSQETRKEVSPDSEQENGHRNGSNHGAAAPPTGRVPRLKHRPKRGTILLSGPVVPPTTPPKKPRVDTLKSSTSINYNDCNRVGINPHLFRAHLRDPTSPYNSQKKRREGEEDAAPRKKKQREDDE